MNVNKEWHLAHRMPNNASIEEKIYWHLQHLQHCHCREDIPVKLKVEMKKRKMKIPNYGSA